MIAALTGMALVLGIGQLLPRHPGTLAALSAAQGMVTATALAARGPDTAWLVAAAVAALSMGVILPFLTWRAAEQCDLMPRPRPAWAVAGAIALSLAVPAGIAGPALGVVLVGLLLVAARPDPVAGVVGLAAMQAGVILALAALAPTPVVASSLVAAVVPLPAGLLLARMIGRWAR